MMSGGKAAERRSAHGPRRMRQLGLCATMSLRFFTPERHDAEQKFEPTATRFCAVSTLEHTLFGRVGTDQRSSVSALFVSCALGDIRHELPRLFPRYGVAHLHRPIISGVSDLCRRRKHDSLCLCGHAGTAAYPDGVAHTTWSGRRRKQAWSMAGPLPCSRHGV
jgi:hypothetical protein